MTPHFICTCDLIPLKDGVNWRLAKKYGFWSPATGLVSVPAGFVTDLASVPRLFWNIVAPFTIAEEAVIHDWLYRTQHFSRETSDKILLQAMVAMKRKWILRQVVYLAVRFFGEAAWRDDERKL